MVIPKRRIKRQRVTFKRYWIWLIPSPTQSLMGEINSFGPKK
jgi:hypothetical protein